MIFVVKSKKKKERKMALAAAESFEMLYFVPSRARRVHFASQESLGMVSLLVWR